MIEAKELSRFRKALRYLLKRDYSHNEALDIIVTIQLMPLPNDGTPWTRDMRLKAFADQCSDADDISSEAISGLTDMVESDYGFRDDQYYLLARLASMCYGEHVVETQRKRIERKGYKLSEDGAQHLFERERERYAEAEESANSWGLNDPDGWRLSSNGIIEVIVAASAGRLPRKSYDIPF